MKSVVIETRAVEREYGYPGVEAIVDHPQHGRLLVIDGFGGKDSLRGGAVRFEHGRVCKLLPEDTFEALDAEWNEYTSVMDAVTSGHDSDRPLLDWDGMAVAGLAKSCGLDQSEGANVHLRVPAEVKARWVRMSRSDGRRLGEWLVERIERALRKEDRDGPSDR